MTVELEVGNTASRYPMFKGRVRPAAIRVLKASSSIMRELGVMYQTVLPQVNSLEDCSIGQVS